MKEGALGELDAHAAMSRIIRLRDDSKRGGSGSSSGGSSGGTVVDEPTELALARLPTGAGLGGSIVSQPSTGGQTNIGKGFSGAGGSGVFGGLAPVGPGGATSAAGQALLSSGGGGLGGTLGLGETRERGADGTVTDPTEGGDGGGGGGGAGKVGSKIGKAGQALFEFIDRYNSDGDPKQDCPAAFWEPDAIRMDDMREIDQPARSPKEIAVFVSPQIISDVTHAFFPGPGGGGGAGGTTTGFCDTAPALYSPGNRSTRFVDQHDEAVGNDFARGEALCPSGLYVLDNPSGTFTVAHVVGSAIGGASDSELSDGRPITQATHATSSSISTVVDSPNVAGGGGGGLPGTGMCFDGKRGGFWDTLLKLNREDQVASGTKRGTPICIVGVRQDAHFEYGDDHGRIFFDPFTDLTNFLDARDFPIGIPMKATMAKDPTVANVDTALGHETVQWRPWFRLAYFIPEDGSVTDGTIEGPTGIPGGSGQPPGGPNGTPVALVIPGSGHGMSVGTDNVVSEDKLSYLIMTGGQGTTGERNVLFTSQGNGTGSPTWGMTLAPTTHLGSQLSDAPTLQIGDDDEEGRFVITYSTGLAEVQTRYLTAAGAVKVAQVRMQNTLDLSDASTSVISFNQFSKFGLFVATTTPGVSFPNQFWFESSTSGSEFHYRTTTTALDLGVKFHVDPEAPEYTACVTALCFHGPLTSDAQLVSQFNEGSGTPNNVALIAASAPGSSGLNGGDVVLSAGAGDGAGVAGRVLF